MINYKLLFKKWNVAPTTWLQLSEFQMMKPGAYTAQDIRDNDIAAHSYEADSHRFCTFRNCTQKFASLDEFKQHLVQHFNLASIKEMIRSDTVGGVRYHTCILCQHSSRDRSNIRRHVKAHLNFKQHQCTHCSFRSIQKSQLMTHMLRRHGVASLERIQSSLGLQP